MKKVININFQGRVIPIEETAYELLKQYIESLRIYFAKEEGRDEIINDIEGRIAELFSERLKTGGTCITDDDVNVVIAGMGRPADFEAAEGEPAPASGSTNNTSNTAQPVVTPVNTGRQRLYRNADDKIIAGVCSGLANYLGIDPVIMRIVFVVFVGVCLGTDARKGIYCVCQFEPRCFEFFVKVFAGRGERKVLAGRPRIAFHPAIG